MSAKTILSPKIDCIFKQIMGDQNRLDILADFLQAVLDLPTEEYAGLVIVDPHLKKLSPDDKMGILDVKINTKSGHVIDVEIQLAKLRDLRARLVYYLAKMVTEQGSSGQGYLKLKRAVSIVITDSNMVKGPAYHHRYRLNDEKTGDCLTDLIEVNVLELPKLPPASDSSPLWNWLAFLAAKTEEEFEMAAETNPVIAKAYGVLKELSADEATRLLAESREKAFFDDLCRYEAAMEEGLEKGMERGMEKGRKEQSLDTARALLSMNMAIEDIAKATALSNEEVKRLALEKPPVSDRAN